jgi:uncharacterized protein (DUF302 family)
MNGEAPRLIEATTTGSVAEAVHSLRNALDRRGIQVFAIIDHAAGARSAGLELTDETVVIFGNPSVGTALMQADPRTGIELPLRMLVWSDGEVTHIAHRDVGGLATEFELGTASGTLTKLGALMLSLVEEITTGG